MMLIGYGMPIDGTWSVNTADGAAITSPTSQLNDGRPDTLTSFTWLTGTQNTSSVFRLRYDWTSGAIVPRVVGVSNISLPIGTKMQVAFRRSGDAGGTYPYTPTMAASEQRVFAGPHGQRTALLLVQPGATAVVGVEFQISNDVDGVASIPAAAPFTLGEAFAMQGADVLIDKGWSQKWSDPPSPNFSATRQGFPGYIEPPWRTLDFKLPLRRQGSYFGDPAAPTAIDVEQLFARIDRNQVALYVPRYTDASGAFSAQMLHRTAMLGVATKLPATTQKAGTLFEGGSVTAVEYPIPV